MINNSVVMSLLWDGDFEFVTFNCDVFTFCVTNLCFLYLAFDDCDMIKNCGSFYI